MGFSRCSSSQFVVFVRKRALGSPLLLAFGMTLTAAWASGAPLNVSSDQTIPEDSTASYDSVSVSNGAVLTIGGGSGITVTGAVNVTGNSSIVFAGKNAGAQVGGEWVGEGSSLTAASVTVDSGSAIHADGQGYTTGLGPGGGGIVYNLGGPGGSYGGVGTTENPALQTMGYGSMLEPTDLGSAGSPAGSTTLGGGAIRLEVSGTLTVNGTLSADGLAGNQTVGGIVPGGSHAGATGGSIWITTAGLDGTGTIHANAAGKGIGSRNQESGGGRVAIYFQDASGFTDMKRIEANGAGLAQDGTVYLRDTSAAKGAFVVPGRLILDAGATFDLVSLRVNGGQIEMGAGAVIKVEEALTLSDAGRILVDWDQVSGRIEAGNLTIGAGSVISADGMGYPSGEGPGGPGPELAASYVGGSHGGRAGGTGALESYGDSLKPETAGSAGGFYSATTNGGGVIRIVVEDTMIHEGLISANGTASGFGHAGAAGGSIWVETSVLKGAGIFQADASPEVAASRENSSGGRIAVYFEEGDEFTGFVDSTADAGAGDVEDGTVVFLNTSGPEHEMYVYDRVDLGDGFRSGYERITIDNGGRLELGGGSFLVVSDRFDLRGESVLEIGSIDAEKTPFGEYIGRGGAVAARNLFIEEGSRIIADGHGYGTGEGPGGPPGGPTAYWVGGSHGGKGGGASAPTYGNPEAPIELGSSGGVYFSEVRGGGAIELIVLDELTVDGVISADGTVVSNAAHSGATGGSIWIRAGAVSGSGLIRANASIKGATSSYVGSGGGRIAIGTVDSMGLLADQLEVKATDASAGEGTVALQELDPIGVMRWLTDIPFLIGGSFDLSWAILDSSGETVSTLWLIDGETEAELLTSVAAAPLYSWDTTAVPDGDYALLVTVADSGGKLIGELRADVVVANEYDWHTGSITDDETWSADRLHIIRDDLSILDGATVTIEPGTRIKVTRDSLVSVRSRGTLDMPGTEALPIVFTSIFDDAIEGDTNRDGGLTAPSAGDWSGVSGEAGSQIITNDQVSYLYAVNIPGPTISGVVRWQGRTTQWVRQDVTLEAGSTLILEAGVVVKFGPLNGLIMEPGANLVSEGTAAEPVVLTSVRDDTRGGDTNRDGDSTAPEAGDWRWIYVNGAKVTLNHTHILYGGGSASGWSQTGVIRTLGNSEVLIENSLISDAFYDGVLSWGGPVTIRNSIFRNIDRAVSVAGTSTVTIRNSTFDRNRIGLHLHGGSFDVANTIVANSFTTGLERDLGGDFKTMSHCLFYNPRATMGEVSGAATFVGTNGNIEADPGFLSSIGGEYRLRSGSAAIDAGDTAAAPAEDKNGFPRVNEPSVTDTGVAGAGGVVADIGAFEYVEGAESEIDLVVIDVVGPLRRPWVARPGSPGLFAMTAMSPWPALGSIRSGWWPIRDGLRKFFVPHRPKWWERTSALTRVKPSGSRGIFPFRAPLPACTVGRSGRIRPASFLKASTAKTTTPFHRQRR